MQKIIEAFAAMPNSSLWWPIIFGGAWSLFCFWPRRDGGMIPYNIALAAPGWVTLGPILFFWLAWAVIVATT